MEVEKSAGKNGGWMSKDGIRGQGEKRKSETEIKNKTADTTGPEDAIN